MEVMTEHMQRAIAALNASTRGTVGGFATMASAVQMPTDGEYGAFLRNMATPEVPYAGSMSQYEDACRPMKSHKGEISR